MPTIPTGRATLAATAATSAAALAVTVLPAALGTRSDTLPTGTSCLAAAPPAATAAPAAAPLTVPAVTATPAAPALVAPPPAVSAALALAALVLLRLVLLVTFDLLFHLILWLVVVVSRLYCVDFERHPVHVRLCVTDREIDITTDRLVGLRVLWVRVCAFPQQVSQQSVTQLALLPLQFESTRLLALNSPQLLLLQVSALLQLLQPRQLHLLPLHLLLLQHLRRQTCSSKHQQLRTKHQQ